MPAPLPFRRTLVLGDVHGAHKALEQVLARSGFDPLQDRLISLGDLTDYHPDNAEVIETLMAIPQLVAVRGNHDIWVHEYLETGEADPLWLHNGGEATVESIYWRQSGVQERYRRFFMKQVKYFIDEDNRLFVHAGIAPDVPMDMQPDLYLYWERKLWTMAAQWGNDIGPWPAHDFHEIYVGHTPTHKFWPDLKPVHFGNIWNLDQGIKRDGRLTLMDVATKEFWQSDKGTELYPMTWL
jgi:serine/threonine protein phosphatase 1